MTEWREPPAELRLEPGVIHLWRIDLPSGEEPPQDLLAEDERARAARYLVDPPRVQFVAARTALRRILGGLLGIPPADLRFTYGPRGKPDLPGHPLRFNLSHSDALALLAVCLDRELGVDVERVRADVETAQIARRFFSPREVAALEALPAGQQARGFFHCWTRKEAYIKALGEGLFVPLDAFDVALAPGAPAGILRSPQGGWSLWDVEADPDYCAAVAVAGEPVGIRLWRTGFQGRTRNPMTGWTT